MRAREFEAVNRSIMRPGWEKRERRNGLDLLASYNEPRGQKILSILAYDSNGKEIGNAHFEVIDDHLESFDTYVRPDLRHQGVATAMYNYAQELGNDINPSAYQTGSGKKFWRARKARPQPVAEVFNTQPGLANQAKWTHTPNMDILHFVAGNNIVYELAFADPRQALEDTDFTRFLPSGASQQLLDRGIYVELEQESDDVNRSGKRGIEGTGSSQEIFGITYNAIIQYVKSNPISWITYYAIEPSRQRLYSSISKKIAQALGWTSKEYGGVFVIYDLKQFHRQDV